MRVVGNNNKVGTVEWKTEAVCPNSAIAEIVDAVKLNDIFMVFVPVTVVKPNGESKTFGDNKDYILALQNAGVNAMTEAAYNKHINDILKGKEAKASEIKNKEDFNNMMNDKESVLVMDGKAIVAEWDAKFEEVAEHIIKNGTDATCDMINNASDEDMIAAIDKALNQTGNAANWTGCEETKKKNNAAINAINNIKDKAKNLGVFSKLGKLFKKAWAKVWAAIKGAGKFVYHTAKIIGKTTWFIAKGTANGVVNAGKEIGNAFVDDIWVPVKRA